MKDLYDEMRAKTERIVAIGLELAKGEMKKSCKPDCASCLAAEARGKDDEIEENNLGFARGDVCMLEARGRLAEQLKWEIN